ncbi:MAG: hypothetical protein A2Z20_02800 [Bdellovibrionales bacterium RBG_16_40_8]|nr:MAG: hypothetical protein A2Z20_02800 [Bdellovibrionales bacterium RBG_16_40_8]
MGVILAKHYIDNLKIEIRKGMDQRWDEGHWNGPAPVEYKNVRDDGGRASIEVDHSVAPFLKEAFELYSTGNITTGINFTGTVTLTAYTDASCTTPVEAGALAVSSATLASGEATFSGVRWNARVKLHCSLKDSRKVFATEKLTKISLKMQWGLGYPRGTPLLDFRIIFEICR